MSHIELNGIANMALVIDLAAKKGKIDQDLYMTLKYELDILERYMIAIQKYHASKCPIVKNKGLPFWHEIRDNRSKFPTRKELGE